MADEVTRPRPEGEETVQDIQIMLKSEANPVAIRHLTVSCKIVFVFVVCFFLICVFIVPLKAIIATCKRREQWTLVV